MRYIVLPFTFYVILIFITYILFVKNLEHYQEMKIKMVPAQIKLTPELKEAISNKNTTPEQLSSLMKENITLT